MTPSQRPPSPLVEALCDTDNFLCLVETFDWQASHGHHADAGRTLSRIVATAAELRPILKGVIAAQREAAKLRDLSERMPGPRLICGAFWGVPNPHPHTPHSEHHATPDTTQPAA
jgi:hypothetical protein